MAGVKGRSGPRPKPAAMHELQGTYREDRHGGGLDAPQGRPEPPAWLNKLERAEWKGLIEQFAQVDGLLAKIDYMAVASFCEAIVELQDARAEIERTGPTAVSDSGSVYQHPAVGRKNKALDRIKYWIARFGMSPSDRAALRGVGSGETPKDPFDDYLQNRLSGSN